MSKAKIKLSTLVSSFSYLKGELDYIVSLVEDNTDKLIELEKKGRDIKQSISNYKKYKEKTGSLNYYQDVNDEDQLGCLLIETFKNEHILKETKKIILDFEMELNKIKEFKKLDVIMESIAKFESEEKLNESINNYFSELDKDVLFNKNKLEVFLNYHLDV